MREATQGKYRYIPVKMVGEDGNVFACIGRVKTAMRRAGVPQDEVTKMIRRLMSSSSYDEVLQTIIGEFDAL